MKRFEEKAFPLESLKYFLLFLFDFLFWQVMLSLITIFLQKNVSSPTRYVFLTLSIAMKVGQMTIG